MHVRQTRLGQLMLKISPETFCTSFHDWVIEREHYISRQKVHHRFIISQCLAHTSPCKRSSYETVAIAQKAIDESMSCVWAHPSPRARLMHVRIEYKLSNAHTLGYCFSLRVVEQNSHKTGSDSVCWNDCVLINTK